MTDDFSLPNAPLDPPQKKRSNTLIIVLVVIVLLLCCCAITIAGGVWLYNNGDELFSLTMQALGKLVL